VSYRILQNFSTSDLKKTTNLSPDIHHHLHLACTINRQHWESIHWLPHLYILKMLKTLEMCLVEKGLNSPGIESQWSEIFRTCPDQPWGPPSHLYKGYRVFPGGRKQLGSDADPSPPSSAEV
jgi:hypothetical protein